MLESIITLFLFLFPFLRSNLDVFIEILLTKVFNSFPNITSNWINQGLYFLNHMLIAFIIRNHRVSGIGNHKDELGRVLIIVAYLEILVHKD